MPKYFAALTIVLMIGTVLTRVLILKRKGVEAMKFAQTNNSDFFILPFALFYFYLVFAAAFDWPTVSRQTLFGNELIAWVGVSLCLAGLLFLISSIVSFGKSF